MLTNIVLKKSPLNNLFDKVVENFYLLDNRITTISIMDCYGYSPVLVVHDNKTGK